MASRTVIVGATGLGGREILAGLLADPAVAAVHSLGRKKPAVEHSKLKAHVVDFAGISWGQTTFSDERDDMKKIFRAAVVSLAVFSANQSLSAPSRQPLSLSATSMVSSYGSVKFSLDKKYVCNVDGDDQCIFSTDCSNFAGQQCVQVDIKEGKHLVKVDYGDGQVSQWIKLDARGSGGADSHMVECTFVGGTGSAKFHLDCE